MLQFSIHICANDTENTGKDSCQSDSGGPLFLTENARYAKIGHYYEKLCIFFCRNTVVGVTSFGDGCGDPQYPGVYARITEEVKTWIQATAAGTESSDCKLLINLIIESSNKGNQPLPLHMFYIICIVLCFRCRFIKYSNHSRTCW